MTIFAYCYIPRTRRWANGNDKKGWAKRRDKMRAYMVRLINTCDLVGIFVAESRHHLQSIVDECAAINACEYAPLPSGGIMWGQKAIEIPTRKSLPWTGAGLTEMWASALSSDIPPWQPLVQEGDLFADLRLDYSTSVPEDPEPPPPKRPRLRLVK